MIVTFGLGGNQIVLRGYGENATHSDYIAWTDHVTEGVPLATFYMEGIPGRGASQDGAWTDPALDGAWTEESGPDGAYTQDNSYLKEFRPIWTIMTKEGLPGSTFGVEGKPSNTRTKEGVPA